LENIDFYYDNGYQRLEVFKNLNFTFPDGINIIWGSNGAGKSSLLKLISGRMVPASGFIKYGKRDITFEPKHRRNFFFISQVPYNSLSEESTVFENLTAVSPEPWFKLFKLSAPPRERKFRNNLSEERWLQQTGTLSGGQAQQLNLLLCAESEAELIIADEVTSGMDENNFLYFSKFLESVRNSHKTLILVTHDERLRAIKGNHILLSNKKLSKIPSNDTD
jgi:ABC-type multidrug transport system ATPase subunit